MSIQVQWLTIQSLHCIVLWLGIHSHKKCCWYYENSPVREGIKSGQPKPAAKTNWQEMKALGNEVRRREIVHWFHNNFPGELHHSRLSGLFTSVCMLGTHLKTFAPSQSWLVIDFHWYSSKGTLPVYMLTQQLFLPVHLSCHHWCQQQYDCYLKWVIGSWNLSNNLWQH